VKFEVLTPLGFTVRTSENYWQRLITKHPDIEDLEEFVQQALTSPDEVQRIKRMQSRKGNQYGTDKSFL
jgi:hypothetical protein